MQKTLIMALTAFLVLSATALANGDPLPDGTYTTGGGNTWTVANDGITVNGNRWGKATVADGVVYVRGQQWIVITANDDGSYGFELFGQQGSQGTGSLSRSSDG